MENRSSSGRRTARPDAGWPAIGPPGTGPTSRPRLNLSPPVTSGSPKRPRGPWAGGARFAGPTASPPAGNSTSSGCRPGPHGLPWACSSSTARRPARSTKNSGTPKRTSGWKSGSVTKRRPKSGGTNCGSWISSRSLPKSDWIKIAKDHRTAAANSMPSCLSTIGSSGNSSMSRSPVPSGGARSSRPSRRPPGQRFGFIPKKGSFAGTTSARRCWRHSRNSGPIIRPPARPRAASVRRAPRPPRARRPPPPVRRAPRPRRHCHP